jgi:phenylacetic acid degradation operon negative regulatory protein
MDPLLPLITALHSQGRLRVWSLVITVFGDLVQHRGGQISTALLGQLLARVGVEPGAMRTALSRLGRDGWVESERQGRTSTYRLSAQGLERFAPATTRIYAPPRRDPGTRGALYPRVDGATPQVFVCPENEAPADADCTVTGDLVRLTDAYRQTLLSVEHRDALTWLAADLTSLGTVDVSSLDAAAARMLLVHRWRRIVLRFPEVPPELMPPDAPLANPRKAVADVYAALNAQTEAWLDQSGTGTNSMPRSDPDFAKRFTAALRA